MRQAFRALALASSMALAGCGEGTGPDTVPCPANPTTVELKVTTGDQLTFDWTPNCAMAGLIVESASGGDQWIVVTFDPDGPVPTPETGNRILPRVTYGQVPQHAVYSEPPLPLVQGTTYQAALWRIVPSGGAATCVSRLGDVCVIATKTFIR